MEQKYEAELSTFTCRCGLILFVLLAFGRDTVGLALDDLVPGVY